MTCKQFYIVLGVFVISLKLQKMPCLVSNNLGKDSWILISIYFVVNLLLIMLAYWAAKRTKDAKFTFEENAALRWLKNLLLIFVAAYFLLQSVLFYESIQDLFAHILFDNLPWAVFSLLLIAEVFFLANSGLKNITLNFELYSVLIFISLGLISIFGGLRTDFTSILPLETVNFSRIASSFVDFNFWFGDFFVVFLLARNAKDIKLGWTVLVYAVCSIFVVVMFVEFWGIYQSYATMQPSLVSVLTEQSMLGVDIGRVDWFLILFAQIGTILSAGLCLHFAKKSLAEVFPKIKQGYLAAGLVATLYLLDVFLLVDLHIKQFVFTKIVSYFGLAVKVVLIIVGLVIATCSKSSKKQTEQSNLQSNSQQSENITTQKPSESKKIKCSGKPHRQKVSHTHKESV